MYLTLFLIKVLTMSNYTLNVKSNFVGKGKKCFVGGTHKKIVNSNWNSPKS